MKRETQRRDPPRLPVSQGNDGDRSLCDTHSGAAMVSSTDGWNTNWGRTVGGTPPLYGGFRADRRGCSGQQPTSIERGVPVGTRRVAQEREVGGCLSDSGSRVRVMIGGY